MKKNEGITMLVLVITVILLLILSGITIQGITHNGIFSNAKQAELENKRAQIVEYLRLKVIYEQTNNPFGSAEEIITATSSWPIHTGTVSILGMCIFQHLMNNGIST